MKILGVIVEYNPFHNGHLYHLEKSKKISGSTHTVAVMSGHFLQRGEPALMDKWTRARIAVENGVDLVIELPFAYSCQSADIFAYGSIQMLHYLNIVDTVVFGCEDNDLDALMKVKNIIRYEPKDFQVLLKKYLNEGKSFPKARELALQSFLPGQEKIISTPNNILAIAYLKWLDTFNSPMIPIPIRRKSTGYHDIQPADNIASATYIRNEIAKHNKADPIALLVPPVTFRNMVEYEKAQDYNHLENYYPLIKSNILRSTKDELSKYFDVNEGLENRIFKAFGNSTSMDNLIKNMGTKRYTSTRIKRILFNHLLNHNKKEVFRVYKDKHFLPYTRILAFNEKGKEIIVHIKNNSSSPMITNVGRAYHGLTPQQQYVLDKDILATDFYNLPLQGSLFHMDYYKKPEIIK
ncbi:MAG: nucleotidyltransferase [Eubacteriales bacterium]